VDIAAAFKATNPSGRQQMPTLSEQEIQQRYYADTANRYDAMHVDNRDEHYFALSILIGAIDFLNARSVLDVGSGTGRALEYLKKHRPGLRVVGIEPVAELRKMGYGKGLSSEELIDGDATKLQFGTDEFDVVCEFGILHHIGQPSLAVAEMIRVSRKAVFISDCNNFGQGGLASRFAKQSLNAFGLWRIADLVKTRGKGYTISEGDGLAYSYSVFNSYAQIRKACRTVHLINTLDGGPNLYRTASHVALLGIKK
jgi:ubiquinone/menaquinone biosynthesis C-methylase UbiE